jgi:glycosyltransferase involved in cell wall biosynthesis
VKVLFLPSWYPTEENSVNGTFVREHARAVALYHEVVVLYPCRGGSGKDRRPGLVWKEELDGGIRTVRIRYPAVESARANWLLFVCIVLWGIWKLRDTFAADVIHAHVLLPAGFAGAVASRILGVPLIITEQQGPFSVQMQTWRQRALVRYATRCARAIMPVSDSLRHDMQSYGLDGRYFVTPNTVDFAVFHPASEAIGAPPRILVAALLTPQKGISFFLNAVAMLRHERQDFGIDIVGDGQERSALEGLAERLAIETCVSFHGLKTKEEVASFMQRCAFLVLPSLGETFGCVVAEALACGRPVVVTRCGGPEEFVSARVGVLAPPGDARALARAIAQMLESWRAYDPAQTSNYARERFSHQAVGARISEVYGQVLSPARGPSASSP